MQMCSEERKTIKVIMICAAGMSSSLLETKIKKAADAANVSFELRALSVPQFGRWDPDSEKIDVVLVAPQVRYKRRSIAETMEPRGVIVQDIDPIDYGMVNGEKILKKIIAALAERDKG
jgi:PTS system cellobiose-specific IIB component